MSNSRRTRNLLLQSGTFQVFSPKTSCCIKKLYARCVALKIVPNITGHWAPPKLRLSPLHHANPRLKYPSDSKPYPSPLKKVLWINIALTVYNVHYKARYLAREPYISLNLKRLTKTLPHCGRRKCYQVQSRNKHAAKANFAFHKQENVFESSKTNFARQNKQRASPSGNRYKQCYVSAQCYLVWELARLQGHERFNSIQLAQFVDYIVPKRAYARFPAFISPAVKSVSLSFRRGWNYY